MHFKPTARYQISIVILENKLWRTPLHNLFSSITIDILSHEKYIKDGKVLAHLWLS